jgi:hypothetical protein
MQRFPAAAASAFCAVLFFAVMLATSVNSGTNWSAFDLLPAIPILIVPLTLVVWSIVSGDQRQQRTLLWARRLVQCHCALAVVTFVVGCTPLVFPRTPARDLAGLGGLIAVVVDLVFLLLTPRPSSDLAELRIFRRVILRFAGGSLIVPIALRYLTVDMAIVRLPACPI